ncbi:type II secretion system protein [Bacillus kexueae]|uniref:type II secretion system protein n=1 Tax=Aeribacillus kexueae TaxID=2078952 RepID=UPI001FAF33F4|nr:type II secretion system protein [Bacillus kexueae]
MFKKHLNNERGLTLVELLAVIVILGIIAAVAVPAIGNIIENSKVDGAKADAIAMLNAAKLYELDGGTIDSDGVTSSELSNYLETAGTEWETGEPVVTKDSSGTLVITGTATGASQNVEFTNASIADINNHKSGKDGYSIGAASSGS